MFLLALISIAFSLIQPHLVRANYTEEAILWAQHNVIYVQDNSLDSGAYCDCSKTPPVVHIGRYGMSFYNIQHETQHAWDWHYQYNKDIRLADTRILAEQDDVVGELARDALYYAVDYSGPRGQVEHLNTRIIERLNHRIAPIPQWYRLRHAANRKVVYSVYIQVVDKTRIER